MVLVFTMQACFCDILETSLPLYGPSMKILVKDAHKKRKAFQRMGLVLGDLGLMSGLDGFYNKDYTIN